MTAERALQLMEIELACVSREDCDRDCANCDLVQEREDLIEAYKYVIHMLKNDQSFTPSSDIQELPPIGSSSYIKLKINNMREDDQ